jgi:hypothetical protein
MTVTATKIDNSHERGKNVITWAWPASTTIIYNNCISLPFPQRQLSTCELCIYVFLSFYVPISVL